MEPTRISIEDALREYETNPRLVFLDTRSQEAWEKSGEALPNSIRIAPDTAEQNLEKIPRDRPIITYCT